MDVAGDVAGDSAYRLVATLLGAEACPHWTATGPPPLGGGGRRFDPVILHSSRTPRWPTGSGIGARLAPPPQSDTRRQEAPRNATSGHVWVAPEALRAPVMSRVTAALVTSRERVGRSRLGMAWARGPPGRRGPRDRALATPAPETARPGVPAPGRVPTRKQSVLRLYASRRPCSNTLVGSIDEASAA